jgi:hypothetical protein
VYLTKEKAMKIRDAVFALEKDLSESTKKFLNQAVDSILNAKKNQGKVVVVTGSGPNLHEGVSTLIAELISKDIVDGVTTSSAVVAHEMAGTLDKVKRIHGIDLGIDAEILPKGGLFEITEMDESELMLLEQEMIIDSDLIRKSRNLSGQIIIKAAGNMAYPMGLRTERLAKDILLFAQSNGLTFEEAAGKGADPRTMIGAGARKSIPVLVTVPQLIGGGMVGLCIGDSISITERTSRMSRMLGSADVIIESAVALTQEIHDGPFETYTGHGIWSDWDGYRTFSLKDKVLIRIDLDPNLKKAWDFEQNGKVQNAIDQGLPKTKFMAIPFRMEMSGFARLDHCIPVIGDIGIIWPLLACKLEQALGLDLDFMSCPQGTAEGQAMREWIVNEVKPISHEKIFS